MRNLPVIHEIQAAFDSNPTADVRGVFLDILKAFDKVLLEGLLFKLKSYSIESKSFYPLEYNMKTVNKG